MQINYRTDGKMFVIPKKDRVVVIISIDFADETDKSISKVFCRSS